MSGRSFDAWLKDWLARHPLRQPPASLERGYATEGMRRVRAAPEPAFAWRWPRLAAACAAVAVLAAVVILRPSGQRLAEQVERDAAVLASVAPAADPSSDSLEDEIETVDHLTLAGADLADEDAAWIDETQQLLQELDDDAGAADPADLDLEDLQWIDDAELGSV